MLPTAIQVPPSYTVPVDAAIVWFASVYEFLLALNAMHDKNNMLLFAICITNILVVVFAALQYPALKGFCESMPKQRTMFNEPLVDLSKDIWPRARIAQLMVPILGGLCTVGIWPLAYQLHKQYAWSIYRSVQGDVHTRARYLAYEVSTLA